MAENELRWLRISHESKLRKRRANRERWRDIPREVPFLSNELAYGFDLDISTCPCTLVESMWGDHYGMDLYGRLGLHCYNFQKKTNFQFKRWEKFSSRLTAYNDYYITLEAKDPACNSLVSFQTLISDAGCANGINIRWKTLASRIKCNESVDDRWDDTSIDPLYKGPMPKWLSDADLGAGDSEKYYVVKYSELRDNYDWLQLFSEIAFYSKEDCALTSSEPFEIDRVVVQTNPDARQKLKEANAIFYISCKFNNPTGEVDIRNAITRKTMDTCFLKLQTKREE